ncbi:MAG: D-alanine--D-alanine ligase [candidate division Zixibacteria bacterium]|nr:D-alanine--D-alanine ligase [candidate division Zixibacteria bacterium]
MKVLVLMGGNSAEREVSLSSGKAIIEGLKQAGHQVLAIDTARPKELIATDSKSLSDSIKTEPPDLKALRKLDSQKVLEGIDSSCVKDVEVIFLALHGGSGEDGTIQALLELSGKPYTGSGVLASALAMNKEMSKKIFKSEGILTPPWVTWNKSDPVNEAQFKFKVEKLGFPIVIKPHNQGSTVGVTIIESSAELKDAIKHAEKYSDVVLAEKFVPGREITVGIVDKTPLPVLEIVPEHGIYDYECKYTTGKSNYICPAELSEELAKEAQGAALKAYLALDCEGYARVDFRLGTDNKFYCLEVNTLPGMTAHSLVPKAAQKAGIGFSKLLDKIVALAVKRKKRN